MEVACPVSLPLALGLSSATFKTMFPLLLSSCVPGSTADKVYQNESVLALTTVPNVILNQQPLSLDDEGSVTLESAALDSEKHLFFAGDWRSLHVPSLFLFFAPWLRLKRWHPQKWVRPASYDTILMSETIYQTQTYPVLEELMHCLLKKGGVALVAAKTYYFGVGGSSDEFIQSITERHRFTLSHRESHGEEGGIARDVMVFIKQ